MRRSISLVLVSLTLAMMGCGAHAARPAAPDTSLIAADDPSWTPPGMGDLAIRENEPAPPPVAITAASTLQPNKAQIAKHQVHAASY